MPRRPKPRTIGSEDNLAHRIQYEREQRGWSPSKLAERMTEAGCPMSQSAIWKIEVHKGQPRRRITVDEWVAFANVFGLPIEELVVHPSIAADDEARRLTELIDSHEDEIQRLEEQIVQARQRLSEIAPDLDWQT